MEITEKKLLTISFIMAAFGLVALSIIATRMPPMEFEQVEQTEDGTHVKMSGTIERVRALGDEHTLVEIETTCTVKGIIFGKSADEYAAFEGKEAIITGTKETYEGEIEILVERIEAR